MTGLTRSCKYCDLKESTRNIFRMHGWRVDRAIHNYIYFRYYDSYVSVSLKVGRFLADRFLWARGIGRAFRFVFERYHAKVLTKSDAQKIITLKEDLIIGPDKSARIIPFQHANRIILQEPQFIAVMDCPCRIHRAKHCEPVNVCIAVGKTTAHFWLEHGQKYHVRRINQEEALKVITDARDRGCITTAWFKEETGGHTGVVCSCCRCCCGGLEGMRIAQKFDDKLSDIIPSGYSVEYDPEECKLCGKCAKVCMFDAISFAEDGKRLYNVAACVGCGLCTEECEQHALGLIRDPSKGDPLDLDLVRMNLSQEKNQA